jgi:starvation-inducible outer membrane lipoprotein
MKTLIAVAFLLVLAACSTRPEPLSKPPDDAAVWNLNEAMQKGSNDLIREPVWQQP